MALFRKPRRPRPPEGREAAPPPERTAARPLSAAEQLRERLHEIAAGSTPEEALEPALEAILQAIGAQAGAICLYDSRYGILRLAAERGLSDDGCRRLRQVRRGDPATWDMPLHGLLNRRAYLIESAPRNRYVPRLVENANAVRTVACVPLYDGPAPVGSLVLVTLAPRSLAERDLRVLERPAAELAAIIEAVRKRGGSTEPISPAVTLPPRPGTAIDVVTVMAERDRLRQEIAARLAERAMLAAELAAARGESDRLRASLTTTSEERARLAAELERARAETERVEALSAALAAAEQQRARLAEGLEAAATERAGQTRAEIALERARADAQRAADGAATELETLRRTAARSEAAAEARVAELMAESSVLAARVAEAEATLERERELARTRDREYGRLETALRAATAREHQLREELAGAVGAEGAQESVRLADEARAAAAAEAEVARAALESAQAIVEALEEEATRAHADIERLAGAEHATHGDIERLARELTAARADAAAREARLAETTRERDALREERDRLAASGHEQRGETVALVARLETIAAERDRLRDTLASVAAERDRLGAESAEATAVRLRLDEMLGRETAERTRLTEALGAAQAALAALESAQADREAEAAAARAAEIEQLRAERVTLAAERDAALAQLAQHTAVPVPERVAPVREPVRVVTVSAAKESRRARAADASRKLVAVLDVAEEWERASDGYHVAVLAPGGDIAARLAGISPERILVNLAAPGALGALLALRSAGSTARFWGCIADPGSDRALPLGMIEPATRPLDPEAVLAALGTYTVRGTRVVTAGTDVDALMSLRQALARRGMSVSMAWDAKQAIDLFGVVRPEVVVVDLNLPRRDGYGIVAQIGRVDPLPSALLVPGADDIAGFGPVLADPANTKRFVPLERIVGGAVSLSEAAPAERRHKIRVVGRK